MILLQYIVDAFKELTIGIQTILAFVNYSLELVGDVFLVFLQNHTETFFMASDNSLGLNKQRQQFLLLFPQFRDPIKVFLARLIHISSSFAY